ncbi:MAG TPA: CaiB/BaiF CoA-transferase family protein [Candidatus Angelobacter sp.]
MIQPLKGTKLVTLALNVPGPVAAARLVQFGAECVKVEPPSGDALKTSAPAWYSTLTQGQNIVTLDLKTKPGRQKLDEYLNQADLLLTSFRLSALERLQLDWKTLHMQYPRLCVVNIIGYPPPDENLPGHDLAYQAKLGLLRPPQLPITLHADLAGAERAVNVSLSLLMNRARTGQAEQAYVSLYEAMRDFAGPFSAGLTKSGGILGGSFPFYGLYETKDGWIAVVALEPGFIKRLSAELNLKANTRDELEQIFRTRTAAEWEQWAKQRDLPIVAVVST